MPESSSSCGEAIEPADTITSRAARASNCLPLHGVAHADAALALEQQALRMRAGLDAQIAPRARRIEIDARGAHAQAPLIEPCVIAMPSCSPLL